MKRLLVLLALMTPLFVSAQTTDAKTVPATEPTMVSISAKGADVRGVLHDLFTKAKKSYVLQPGTYMALFLSLDNVEFEEALNIICAQSKLQFEIQNGIYFVSKAKAPVVAAAIPPAPKSFLDKSVLDRKLTIKVAKTDIRMVFAMLAKQTKLVIEVDKAVPAYKLDLNFDDVSLEHALDKIVAAAHLKYQFSDHRSIIIAKPADPEKVGVTGG